MNDSGVYAPHGERIKGYIGNVTAYAQADGGALLESLPPRAEDLVERIMIAFTGSEGDLSRAKIEALGVSLEQYLLPVRVRSGGPGSQPSTPIQ